jgi:hypothetical protein
METTKSALETPWALASIAWGVALVEAGELRARSESAA